MFKEINIKLPKYRDYYFNEFNKHFHDEKNDILYGENDICKFYFKLNKTYCYEFHRLDGPAFIRKKFPGVFFWINNYCCFDENEFANKTDHLICKNCRKFCKQECF